jgi:hypothetical protein
MGKMNNLIFQSAIALFGVAFSVFFACIAPFALDLGIVAKRVPLPFFYSLFPVTGFHVLIDISHEPLGIRFVSFIDSTRYALRTNENAVIILATFLHIPRLRRRFSGNKNKKGHQGKKQKSHKKSFP